MTMNFKLKVTEHPELFVSFFGDMYYVNKDNYVMISGLSQFNTNIRKWNINDYIFLKQLIEHPELALLNIRHEDKIDGKIAENILKGVRFQIEDAENE
jgi:hypothetical protein